jgi:hypothetical protein
MSEQLRKSQNKKVRQQIAATALAASFVGAGVGAAVEKITTAHSNEHAVETIIRKTNQEKDFAISTAQVYTEALNQAATKPGISTRMSVLNGDIAIGGNEGKSPLITYKNPIALFTMEDPNLKIDANGNFLENKWYGIRTQAPDGQLTIQAIQYDEDNMSFKANNADNIMLDVQVSAEWPIKGGPDSVELFAYDPLLQHKVLNPDFSPVMPGYATGMK